MRPAYDPHRIRSGAAAGYALARVSHPDCLQTSSKSKRDSPEPARRGIRANTNKSSLLQRATGNRAESDDRSSTRAATDSPTKSRRVFRVASINFVAIARQGGNRARAAYCFGRKREIKVCLDL